MLIVFLRAGFPAARARPRPSCRSAHGHGRPAGRRGYAARSAGSPQKCRRWTCGTVPAADSWCWARSSMKTTRLGAYSSTIGLQRRALRPLVGEDPRVDAERVPAAAARFVALVDEIGEHHHVGIVAATRRSPRPRPRSAAGCPSPYRKTRPAGARSSSSASAPSLPRRRIDWAKGLPSSWKSMPCSASSQSRKWRTMCSSTSSQSVTTSGRVIGEAPCLRQPVARARRPALRPRPARSGSCWQRKSSTARWVSVSVDAHRAGHRA